ncbi:MAG: hypothetical protein EP319_09080 [Deltaproteobacteria bacterium]|nr:MAG: hypothetical protein EP319_09080 [Deltaproteobacteria bacterium]
MNDKNKTKLKLPPGKSGSLDGFEDVIDIFLEEQEAEEREKSKKDFEKHSANHELYDFLQKEKSRLESLDSLFAEKIPNMMNNPQIDLLLSKQQESAFYKREEVIKAIKAPNSDFLLLLGRIFDSSFS